MGRRTRCWPVEVASWRRQVVAQTDAPEATGSRDLSLSARVPVRGSSWLCARAGGPQYSDPLPHHDVWNRGVFAHTSPIYVRCGDGDWQMADRAGLQYMLTLVDGSLAYIRRRSLGGGSDHVSHQHGEADHQAFLERPFLQARAVLEARLEEIGPDSPGG